MKYLFYKDNKNLYIENKEKMKSLVQETDIMMIHSKEELMGFSIIDLTEYSLVVFVDCLEPEDFTIIDRLCSYNYSIPFIFVSNNKEKLFELQKARLTWMVRENVFLLDFLRAINEIKKVIEGSGKAIVFSFRDEDDDYHTMSVEISHILYIECNGHRLTMHTDYFVESFSGSLLSFEKRCQGLGFVKITKWCLVNMNRVVAIRDDFVFMSNNEKLPIASSKKKLVRDLYCKLTF